MDLSVTGCTVSAFMSGSVRAQMKLNVSQPAFLMNTTKKMDAESLQTRFNVTAAHLAAKRLMKHEVMVSVERVAVFSKSSVAFLSLRYCCCRLIEKDVINFSHPLVRKWREPFCSFFQATNWSFVSSSEPKGCHSDPCKMGKCMDIPGGFKCLCDEGFSGHLCEMPVQECPDPWMVIGQCFKHKSQALERYMAGIFGRHMVPLDNVIAASCGLAMDPEVNVCR